jgi:hypothetical protein
MAEFKIEQRVPSVKVTKKLLESLERYLVSKKEAVQADLKLPPENEKFSISVTDNLGTETFSSTNQLRTDRFLDSTTNVRVSFACRWYKAKTSLAVDVRFSTTPYLASLTVLCEADAARELGVGLYQSLSEITATGKTSNWRYHAPLWLEGPLQGATIGMGLWAVMLMRDHRIAGMVLATVAGLAFAYFSIGKRFHPYTLFDSSRAERIQRAGDWFEYGLLTFLVFGILLTLLRRSLLGF